MADPPLLRLEVEAAAAYLSVSLAITAAATAAAAAAGPSGALPPGAAADAVALARLTNAQERLVGLCLTTLSRYTLGVRQELHALHQQQLQQQQQQQHAGDAPPAAAAPPPRPKLLGFLPRSGNSASGAPPPMPHPHALPQPRYIVVGRTSSGAPVLMAPPAVEFASFSPLALSSICALGELEEAVFRRHLGDLFPLLTQLIRADYAPPDVHRALAGLFARRVQPMVLAAAGTGAVGQAGGPGAA